MTLQETKGMSNVPKESLKTFMHVIANVILKNFNLTLINDRLYYIIKDTQYHEIKYSNKELVSFLGFEKIDKINKFPCNMYEIFSILINNKFFNKHLYEGNLRDTYKKIDEKDVHALRMYINWYKLVKSLDKPNPCKFTTSELVIFRVLENNFKDAKGLKDSISKPSPFVSTIQTQKSTIVDNFIKDKFKFEDAVRLIPELNTFNLSIQLEIMSEFKNHIERFFLLKYTDYLSTNALSVISSDFIEFYYENKENIITNY